MNKDDLHPEGDRLHELASEIWRALLQNDGPLWPFNFAARARARREAESLNASIDYMNRLTLIEQAASVLLDGGRKLSQREAHRMLEKHLPRMQDSAHRPAPRP